MIITTYLPASDFLARTRAELERNKVLNSLSLGITLRLQKSPERVEISLYLATVGDESKLLMAAVMQRQKWDCYPVCPSPSKHTTEAINHSCTLTELDVSSVPASSELDASPPHCKGFFQRKGRQYGASWQQNANQLRASRQKKTEHV